MKTAIIGAGIAGLTCGRALVEEGWPVVVFDKARGPGGRISTRRREGAAFDHGAQYFTVRDARFAPVAEAWASVGVVAQWTGRFGRLVGHGPAKFVAETPPRPRWVGVPRMSAITRHLCAGLDLRTEVRVGAALPEDGRWRLYDEAGAALGAFDRVVVATPAPQAVPLLAASPRLARRAAAAKMSPSWAVMARFDAPLSVPFDAVDVQDGPVGWLARDTSKPGRGEAECWVLHARGGWAASHLELAFEAVAERLVAAVAERVPAFAPAEAVAHRWRYALVTRAVGPMAHLDESGIGACGDWCVGPRVESAWRSGRAMAAALLGEAGAVTPERATVEFAVDDDEDGGISGR